MEREKLRAYPNLRAELARKKVTWRQIANAIETTEKTVYNKTHRISAFSIDEAMTIRDTFFVGMDLEYLFAVSEEQ